MLRPDKPPIHDAVRLEGRGFSLHHRAPSGTGIYTYWWKPQDRTCARVLTSDGRVAETKLVSVSDCGQRSGDGGAVAAVAAAALLGALALSHKSHNREQQGQNYDNNPRQLADFDRGHRDGLYNQPYHNYNDSAEYKAGYKSGVNERDHQTSYRAGSGGWGGDRGYVELSDLIYQDREWALGELGRRGFARTGGYQTSDGRGYSFTYYNRNSRQCVHMSTRDGKVQAVENINEGNCT